MSRRIFVGLFLFLLLSSGCSEDGAGPVTDGPIPTIRDLTIVSHTEDSAILSWTAPGEANTQAAAEYDLRFLADPLIDANWDQAIEATAEPAPSSPGSIDSVEVLGLDAGPQFYFSLRYRDAESRWSGRSNVVLYPPPDDATPPATIRSLTVTAFTDSAVTLNWRATGDDYRSGTASSYDLRITTGSLTPDNFSQATPVTGLPDPAPSGQEEEFTVTGFSERTTYSFGLRVADAESNWSGLSNIVRAPFFWNRYGEGLSGEVRALAEYNGDLIAGGFFVIGGGAPGSIAQWNGQSWVPLGSGVDGSVNALLVFNGELIAGGEFQSAGSVETSHVARWNGAEWQNIDFDSGLPTPVASLAVFNGKLVAGLTGSGTVAVWDGTGWDILAPGQEADIFAIAEFDGELIAAGTFNETPLVARRDGNQWRALGSQIGLPTVRALRVLDERLYAGGGCADINVECAKLAVWDGDGWTTLVDTPEEILSLTEIEGRLVAGGSNLIDEDSQVAVWDDGAFSRFGGNLNGTVHTLLPFGDALVAGGSFTRSNDFEVSRVARFEY